MLGIGLYTQEICCTIDFKADNPDLNVPLWFSLSPLNTCHLVRQIIEQDLYSSFKVCEDDSFIYI